MTAIISESKTTVLNIVPVPKPRMTQSDRWKKRPAVVRYHNFKDEMREQVQGTLEPSFTIVFRVPMPPSWSPKKRELMRGAPHQQKPDIDNYLKAVMDALCEDDSYVYHVDASKYWADEGSIEITEG